MARRPELLQSATAVSWGGTITTTVTDTGLRIWACSLVGSGVLMLCLLMRATVARRIDRMYRAMFSAAMPSGPEPEPEVHGRHRLAVVPEPGPRPSERAVLPG